MAAEVDILIIGAGHNGLVAAFYLARAGLRTLVLERRNIPGGAAVTEEFFPGFRCPTLAHAAGPLLPVIERDLQLSRYGLKMQKPDVRVFAPDPEGRSVCLYEDPARTQSGMERVSPKDARAYGEFHQSFARIGGVLSSLVQMTPPDITHPGAGDLWGMLKLGRGFRGLGKKDAYRLLRWAPMPVADLVGEWFDTDLLRATVAARGIFGAFAGPYSAGTSLPLLMQAALDGQAIGPATQIRGGIGALTRALGASATAAGAQLRTGAEVEHILVKDGAVQGVVLQGGEEIAAKVVVSNADPKRTLLGLLDPSELDPDFAGKIQNYRCLGSAAKVNLALSGLPQFVATGPSGNGQAHLLGRIHIGPQIDYLEQAFDAAKYGEFSPHPYLDITIPSLADPDLAPKGCQVMSIYVQYAPYRLRQGDWPSRREELGDTVVRTLCEYAPDLNPLIVHREVITPLDLEQTYGLTGGHVLHGEPSLDQFFTFRPLLHWARYRTPIGGLYLCGAGTHPGGGVTGAPGANASREIIRDLARGRA